MFKIQIDVGLTFNPPMHENAKGIMMTREAELPFPPFEGLAVFSKFWDRCPDPLGITLKDVTWDVDRETFLATSRSGFSGLTIAEIPMELCDWISQGWRLGSFLDTYGEDAKVRRVKRPKDGKHGRAALELAERVADGADRLLHTLPESERPDVFNGFFKALIRQIARDGWNDDVAYAMDKVGRYFGHDYLGWEDGPRSPVGEREFADARDEYSSLSTDEKVDWKERTEKYPPISDFVCSG